MANDVLQIVAVENARWRRLVAELQHAVKATDRAALAEWSKDWGWTTLRVGKRRVGNLGDRLKSAGEWVYDGARDAFDAIRQRRLREHATERTESNWRNGKAYARRMAAGAKAFVALASNPDKLPETAVLVLAALVSSGGVDGDGGIPDLDLKFGIGAHRSIFFHSIISGTVVEGVVYGVATLVGLVHEQLPDHHDPLWDSIERNRVRYFQAITAGSSAGIAYHLLIDGIVQPAAYHDLPFSAPLEVHQTILVVNGAEEGADATRKRDTFRRAD